MTKDSNFYLSYKWRYLNFNDIAYWPLCSMIQRVIINCFILKCLEFYIIGLPLYESLEMMVAIIYCIFLFVDGLNLNPNLRLSRQIVIINTPLWPSSFKYLDIRQRVPQFSEWRRFYSLHFASSRVVWWIRYAFWNTVYLYLFCIFKFPYIVPRNQYLKSIFIF